MTSPVDSVGPPATLPTTYDPSKATVNASGTGKPTEMFDSKMFLNLLVAQLKYQDPTNPVDTSNFMNQTAMLSQVQTMNTMSTTLSEMMTAQQTASATSMIGKAISFVDPAGKQVTGVVDGVSFHSGAALLHVGDLAVPLAGVLVVADPVALGGGDTSGTGDTSGASGGTDPVDGTSDPTDPADAGATSDAVPVDSATDPAQSGSTGATTDTGSTADSGSTTDSGIAATTRPDTITA